MADRFEHAGRALVVGELSAGGLFLLSALPTAAFTSTVPALPGGVTRVQLVVDSHSTEAAAALPKVNVVAPAPGAKPLPVTVTLVAAREVPAFGLSPAIAGASYVKPCLTALTPVPFGVVTVISSTGRPSPAERQR